MKIREENEVIKYRNELKYFCSEQELRLIENRIREICRPDRHSGEDGIYTIRSVYFDDYYNTCFYENENGTDPREKFRIRIYNGSMERITLECKRKERGLNHKFSCPLSRELCRKILMGKDFSVTDIPPDEQLLMKFLIQYRTRMLRPKVIVEYERTPYVYDLGNVRVTFDRNISSSGRIEEFERPTIETRPVMPVGKHILEVKYDGFLPDYIYNALQIPGLRQTAFSKYYLCRKFNTV